LKDEPEVQTEKAAEEKSKASEVENKV